MRQLSIILSILVVCTVSAQFKYNAGIGLGVTSPDVASFNTSITDSGLSRISSIWLPITYDFSVKIYPSLRVGFFKVSSYLLPNKSSHDFVLAVRMQGISVQTFFTFLKRFEANFGLVPMLGKAEFFQRNVTAKTSPFQFSTTTKAGIKNGAFSFYSWIGLRMYLRSFLAVEGNIGYLRAKFKGSKWKSEDGAGGVKGSVNLTKPFFKLGVVVGW